MNRITRFIGTTGWVGLVAAKYNPASVNHPRLNRTVCPRTVHVAEPERTPACS
ncbi:hypothetical protein [Parapedobacter indicus]|uniref:hypothetical protein n=1 Tax=Parapedobacter indicus TaxID=1477437 RepID=UPI0015A53ECB|nr:hypothetical protein [Parapedobacter indicus]